MHHVSVSHGYIYDTNLLDWRSMRSIGRSFLPIISMKTNRRKILLWQYQDFVDAICNLLYK